MPEGHKWRPVIFVYSCTQKAYVFIYQICRHQKRVATVLSLKERWLFYYSYLLIFTNSAGRWRMARFSSLALSCTQPQTDGPPSFSLPCALALLLLSS
jgi:hypothetical protein